HVHEGRPHDVDPRSEGEVRDERHTEHEERRCAGHEEDGPELPEPFSETGGCQSGEPYQNVRDGEDRTAVVVCDTETIVEPGAHERDDEPRAEAYVDPREAELQ